MALPNIEMSKLRVAERVRQGGHNIPIQDIERRFSRSLYNLLYLFSPKVDYCNCFMNTDSAPVQVFEQIAGRRFIIDESLFQILLEHSEK